MCRAPVLALAAGLLALAPGPRSPAQPPDPRAKAADRELLLGTWSIVGLETAGKAEPSQNYQGNTLRFVRDRFPAYLRLPAALGFRGPVRFAVTRDRAELREGQFPRLDFAVTLDPTKTPKAIDLTAKGNTLRGVYRLDGDDLALCFSLTGVRPMDFTTRPDMPAEAFTLKRVWERFTDRAQGFSAEFPVRPEQRGWKADGPVATTAFVSRSAVDRLTFVLTVTPLPQGAAGANPDHLRGAAEAVAAAAAGPGPVEIRGDAEFKGPGGLAGRELTLAVGGTVPGGGRAVRGRAFVVGDRLYAMAAGGTEDAVKSPNVARFWNSFRHVDRKDPPGKNRN